MRAVFLLCLALSMTACSSSKESASGGTYVVQEQADGDINIMVSEGASGETLMAALMEAAARIEWEPPEAFAGLRREGTEDLGASGTYYRYPLQGGSYSVYVYRHNAGADEQIEETMDALRQVQENGRIESFEFAGREDRTIPWESGEETLTRVLFEETVNGQPMHSYMYLLPDGVWWIKVRATFPKGLYAVADLDAMVLAMLAEEDE